MVGFMAVATDALPHRQVSYCAVVTEHRLPIEAVFRQVHWLSLQIPNYEHGETITFEYDRSSINIDNVHKGDSLLVSGQETIAGVLVASMVPIERRNCIE